MGNSSNIELPFLPSIVDGETLYSWLAHYHRLNGNPCAFRTSMQLFEHKFVGLRWEFQFNLDHFVSVTNGLLGGPEELIFDRSTTGFYAPFHSEDLIESVINQMKGNRANSLKKDLGINSGLFGGTSPLKACLDCIKEDIRKYQISKWYLQHQWPSSFVCGKHGTLLRVAKRNPAHKVVNRFLLPQDIGDARWVECREIPSVTKKALSKVFTFTDVLASRRNFHLNRDSLRNTYLLGAKRKGWLNSNGTVNRAIEDAFHDSHAGLERLPGFERIRLGKGNHHFISDLMIDNGERYHPTRHYFLMAFLFDNPNDFMRAYERVDQELNYEESCFLEELKSPEWHKELPRLIEVDKLSMQRAAKKLNVSHWRVAYQMRKNTKVYRAHSKFDCYIDEFWKHINDGLNSYEIGRLMNISRSTVKYYVDTRAPLREAWRNRNLGMEPNVTHPNAPKKDAPVGRQPAALPA